MHAINTCQDIRIDEAVPALETEDQVLRNFQVEFS